MYLTCSEMEMEIWKIIDQKNNQYNKGQLTEPTMLIKICSHSLMRFKIWILAGKQF
jgi:hypothetical protein